MINRYKNRRILKNDLEQYSEFLKNRNVKYIEYYASPKFNILSVEDYKNIQVINHIWQQGDRYYKLAERYYSDPSDWWVIAKFNLKPTESYIKIGDIIRVPTPLSYVLNYIMD
jgi:nucleoid-associated protein YgaU